MKRIFTSIFVFIILGLCLKGCIKRDVPQVYDKVDYVESNQRVAYPDESKNVTINGVDYLQSQAPIGKFGGEFVISTIGEGPKTFNPCNTKDATSSSMAGLLYDGLLATDARTGKICH